MDHDTTPWATSAPPPLDPRPDDVSEAERTAPERRPGPPPPASPVYPPYPPYASSPRRASRWYVWLIGGCLGVLVLGILGCAVIGGLLAGVMIREANRTQVQSSETRTFAVTGAPTLNVHNIAGQVQVVGGDDGQVTVDITRSARDDSDSAAQRALDAITVDIRQAGDTITVNTTFPRRGGFGSDRRVDLTITVPRTVDVTADVTAGNASVQDVTGRLRLTVTAGEAKLQAVTLKDGSFLHVTTGRASVAGTLQPGASLDVRVTTGQVELRLPADTAARLDARITLGDITVDGWDVTTSRQGVSGRQATGDLGANPVGTITIRVETGGITIERQ